MKTSTKITAFFLALLTATYSLNAADITISNGQTVKYSETTGFTQETNISGPTASGEKGTFTMDIADDTFNGSRYKGKITGNLDVYKTGSKNWRMYNSNSDYVGTSYLQGGNVYLATGKELGKSTIKWTSGEIVNEGNEGCVNSVIDNNIELVGTGNHATRCGWNTTNYSYMTYNGVISGTGNMVYGSGEGTPGTITINGANTYSGTTTLYGVPSNAAAKTKYATYVLGNNAALSAGAVEVKGAVLLDVSNITSLTNNLTFSQQDTFKSTTIQNTGANAVAIGNNTSSTFTVNSGVTVNLTNTGAGSLTLNSKTVTNNGTLNLTNTGAGSLVFQAATLSGTVNLSNTGKGSVSVGTSSSYAKTAGGTLAFSSAGTVYATNGFSANITGPSASGTKATVHFNPADAPYYTGKLSGNLDLYVDASVRFKNNSSDFTGSITSKANIYFHYGNEMGNKKSNVITFNGGQIVNLEQSAPVVPNDIVLNNTITVRAGWNTTSFGGGDKSSITLTGDISGTGGINFNSETNAGAVYLRGNNTYSGNSKVEYGYNASNSAKNRCWFGVGSDTAFGTGSLTLNTPIPTTVLCLETTNGATRKLGTAITVSQNALEFQNSSTGDAYITSAITVNSGKDVQFGSTYSSDENGSGTIYFDGTITGANAVVNTCTTLGGSGTMQNLTVSKGAELYLSSAKNYDDALEIEGLTLNGDLKMDIDATKGTDQPLMTLESLTMGDESTMNVNFTGDPTGKVSLFSVENGMDLSKIMSRMTVTGAGAGYALSLDGNTLTITGNVPEPATWLLLVLGVCFLRGIRRDDILVVRGRPVH